MKLLWEIVQARPKSIIGIGLLLILTTTLAVYTLFWLGPNIEALQISRNEKQRLLSSGGGDMSAIYRQGIADLKTFIDMVPPRKSFARVVSDVLEAARNSGLIVSAVTYKPNPVASGGLIDYALNFSVEGKYAGVKSYLADLQRFKDIVIIDQFSLSGGKTTEEIVDLKLHLTIYLQAVAP